MSSSSLLYYMTLGYYGIEKLVTLDNGIVLNINAPVAPNVYNYVTLENGIVINLDAPKLKTEIPLYRVCTTHGIVTATEIERIKLKPVPMTARQNLASAERDTIESLLQMAKTKLKAPKEKDNNKSQDGSSEFQDALLQTIRKLRSNY